MPFPGQDRRDVCAKTCPADENAILVDAGIGREALVCRFGGSQITGERRGVRSFERRGVVVHDNKSGGAQGGRLRRQCGMVASPSGHQ
jgi:hypothetical protein